MTGTTRPPETACSQTTAMARRIYDFEGFRLAAATRELRRSDGKASLLSARVFACIHHLIGQRARAVNELASRTVADGGSFVIDSRSCAFYPEVYLGPGADVRDPEISPLRSPLTELADLPAALFTVGTLDPLLDDSMLMHERWIEAGNRSKLVLYEDAPHAFDLFPVPEARHFGDARVAFARDCLSS